MAKRTCSKVRYSWCLDRASVMAKFRVIWSSWESMCLGFLGGALQGELGFASHIQGFPDLGFGDFSGVNPRDTDSRPVDMQHDSRAFTLGVVKNGAQEVRDKFHTGEIVVVQKHFEHGRFFRFDPFFEGQSALRRIASFFFRGQSPLGNIQLWAEQSISCVQIMTCRRASAQCISYC
jgi:hypothetical protein